MILLRRSLELCLEGLIADSISVRLYVV